MNLLVYQWRQLIVHRLLLICCLTYNGLSVSSYLEAHFKWLFSQTKVRLKCAKSAVGCRLVAMKIAFDENEIESWNSSAEIYNIKVSDCCEDVVTRCTVGDVWQSFMQISIDLFSWLFWWWHIQSHPICILTGEKNVKWFNNTAEHVYGCDVT